MNSCTNCGSPLQPGLKFCTGCGKPAAGTAEAELPPSPLPEPPASEPVVPQDVVHVPEAQSASEWQLARVVAVPTPSSYGQPLPIEAPAAQSMAPAAQAAASSKSGCLPALLITLAVLAVIAVLVIGGVVYVGYKVKQKATEALHKAIPSTQTTPSPDGAKLGGQAKAQSDDESGVLGGLSNLLGGDDDGDLVQSVSDRDPVEPCSAAPYLAQTGARIPLQEGTVITTAWGTRYGDVESRNLLGARTPASISTTNTTDAHKADDGQDEQSSSNTDTICNADFALAGTYITTVGQHLPHLLHAVTRFRLSDIAFNEVKSSGKTNFVYLDFMSFGDANKPWHDSSLLTRVEPQDVPYPMIVNDERVALPTIHLAGIADSIGKDPRPKKYRAHHAAADIYIIDDPLDPLVLLWKEKDPAYLGGKFRIEVVKIDFKLPHAINLVEKQLAEQKRAVTYGIYFDFNKDTIKPESEPVLKQIVQAMTDNPSWKLTVEGHTDNIGGDSYNLDLSKRRAASVKQALVTRYHIAPDRLSTDGFGSSRPVETNDTLEGRARNRRVELTRE